jgi:hypothetical protein
MFFYSDTAPKGNPVPYNRLNAITGYMKHFDNYLFLKFIQENTKDFKEKAQATKELTICERKMEWWKKHPTYDQQRITSLCAAAKSKWEKK